MPEEIYTSRVRIERVRGPIRHAYIAPLEPPVRFGVHGAIKRFYGLRYELKVPAGKRDAAQRALDTRPRSRGIGLLQPAGGGSGADGVGDSITRERVGPRSCRTLTGSELVNR